MESAAGSKFDDRYVGRIDMAIDGCQSITQRSEMKALSNEKQSDILRARINCTHFKRDMLQLYELVPPGY
jgi:hypothetical protein